jgi:hypothetical protein
VEGSSVRLLRLTDESLSLLDSVEQHGPDRGELDLR